MTRQSTVDNLNTTYSTLMEECAQQEVIVPDQLQQQLNNIRSDWELVKRLADHIKPQSEVPTEEIMKQGTICFMKLKIDVQLFS